MPKYLRPKALKRGDKVGVIAPSFPSAVWFPRRLDASLDGLRRHLGVEPVIAPHVREATGFRSGDARTRAAEFQAFLEDPEIAAIFTTLGGFNSNELLSHPDLIGSVTSPRL